MFSTIAKIMHTLLHATGWRLINAPAMVLLANSWPVVGTA
jgi:hypothetical protein